MIEYGEPFFEKHGPKAVFLGRWVSGLRIASAWLAGMNKMSWPTFLFWNALGGVCWAASIGFAVYLLGDVAEHVIAVAGTVAAGVAKPMPIDPPVGVSEFASQTPRPAWNSRRSSEPNSDASSKISQSQLGSRHR